MADKQEVLIPGPESASLGALARNFLTLGCTAFGGPPVHIGMFRKLFVNEYGWMSEDRFSEIFAMANCLPGPSSTQVAFAIGITQQGVLGGLVSGGTFFLPGAILLGLLGFISSYVRDEIDNPISAANGIAIGCSAVGVALVFVAVTGLVKNQVMAKSDPVKLGFICFGTGVTLMLVPAPAPAWLNPSLIFLGGAITAIAPIDKMGDSKVVEARGKTGLPAAAGVAIMILYVLVAAFTIWMDTFDKGFIMPFLTAGMFVWGGGPVVLPMLMTYLTPAWINPTVFLAGISFAEMMPGPVFNISCFLGVQLALNNGWPWMLGTSLCWLGLMGPGITLIFGAVPLWDKLRNFEIYNKALPGLNAAAVGLLLPTVFLVYNTLEERSPWKSGSRSLAVIAYYLVDIAKVNVPLTVIGAGILGFVWSTFQHSHASFV